jgi:hypothetical protein
MKWNAKIPYWDMRLRTSRVLYMLLCICDTGLLFRAHDITISMLSCPRGHCIPLVLVPNYRAHEQNMAPRLVR